MIKSKNDNFNRKLISIVLPITFQQFMLQLVSASDAFMLGSYSQDAMAAASLAGQIQFIFNLFLMAITIGTGIFVAQYWGKKDRENVENILGIALRITVPVSLIFVLGTIFVPEKLMGAFTSDNQLIKYGAEYLWTVSFSYLFCGISQVYLCIMKNTGRALKSSIISSVCVIINIVLNYVLIFGYCGMPKLGVQGAAIATTIARIVEMIWSLSDSIPKSRIKICKSKILNVEKELRSKFWKYTLPVLGNEFVWGLGFSAGIAIIGHLGSDAVAANSIANIVRNLIVCFCMGIGSGGGIIVGNMLGAGKLELAKQYGSKICKMAIISGAISGAVLLMISPIILKNVNLTPQANEYLKYMLLICSYYIIGKSVNSTTIGGIFCAGGDSKFGLRCDFVTLWCVAIPLGAVAAFILKLPVVVVYFIVGLDEMIKLPAVWKHYKKYIWVKDLTK